MYKVSQVDSVSSAKSDQGQITSAVASSTLTVHSARVAANCLDVKARERHHSPWNNRYDYYEDGIKND